MNNLAKNMSFFSQRAKKKPIEQLSFLIGFFATAPLIRIGAYSLYVWLLCGMIVLFLFLFYLRLALRDILLIATSGCTFVMTNSSLDSSYQAQNINALIGLSFALLLGRSLSGIEGAPYTRKVVEGVIFASKIQAIWIFFQILFWSFLSLDINDLIFNQTLHMREDASQFKASGFTATGLCWNAGGIVACLVIGYLLEKKFIWRIIILFAGILTQSTTALIGLSLCVIYTVIKFFLNSEQNILSARNIILVVSLASISISSYLFISKIQNYVDIIFSVVESRVSQMTGAAPSLDSSASAHFDYYANLPELIKQMNPSQLLFGYGLNSSGLPYTELTHQYYFLDSWFVESDPINTILGMGFAGFGMFVLWLVLETMRAYSSKSRSFILILILVIMGFFYNVISVAYYWLVLVIICLVDYPLNANQTSISLLLKE